MSNQFAELFDKQFNKHKKKPQTDVPINPPQPDLESRPYPRIRKSRTKDEILYVAGNGCNKGGVMFVSPALIEEDAIRYRQGNFGKMLEETPAHMKCLAGQVLKDLSMEMGIPEDHCRYTSVVKWLLPKAKRLKPDTKSLKWAFPAFHDELKSVKPDIVVCLGKQVFDLLCPVKYKADDIRTGWFYSEKYNCRYILLDPFYLLSSRPDYVEKFRINLYEVRKMYDAVHGKKTDRIPTEYEIIENSEQLKNLVAKWEKENRKLFSVDCEWAGNNFIDGKLRTIQFCWESGKACAVKFMDENRDYVFDVDYITAGQILGGYLNRPDVKYIGHHWSADSPWMHHVLKLDIWGKCVLDTEFALQTCDEHADLSLERLALKYTDLGRYDLPLEIWKKTNGGIGPEDGYGDVPDDILLPYSVADTDVVMRVFPIVVKSLIQQELWDYYQNIFNPFVTDGFSNFTITGLPIDMEKLDSLRELFYYAKTELEVEFRKMMVEEARQLVYQVCEELGGEDGKWVAEGYLESPPECSLEVLKTGLGVKNVDRLIALDAHYKIAPEFNIRSGVHMRRWLFGVKNYDPIKSTNQKEKGFPAMAWEKVKGLPKDVQQNYLPAVDKQTLQIYSQKGDKVVNTLLDLNAVGNLLKGFLKPAEIDDEGEIVRENGLHFWVASDGRVHYNSSVTETARNRCWKPNILNWPSYVNERINEGVSRILAMRKIEGVLPEELEYYLDHGVPSIRSIVTAPPGWIICESDYATAEVRGLAFISGCQDLIRLVTQPDEYFGFWKKNPSVLVRLGYSETSGIPVENQDDKFVMAVKVEDEWIKIGPEELLCDEDGNLKHPSATDLHWSVAERMKGQPRETLNKKIDRDGVGKTSNFSCMASDAVVSTDSGAIEITEINTGHKLWDGVEFVCHEGLIKQGKRIVIQHQGLRATPDHVVWTREGTPICLFDALLGNVDIIGSNPGNPVRLQLESPYSRESPEGVACTRRMQEVQRAFNEMATQLEGREDPQMSMHPPREIQGYQSHHVGVQVAVDVPEMSQRQSCIQPQLQRARNRSEILPGGLHKVGPGDVARRDLYRKRLRQDRQRRALRVLQLTADQQGTEPKEYPYVQKVRHIGCGKVQREEPRVRVYPYPHLQPHQSGEKGIRNTPDVQGGLPKGSHGREERQETGTASCPYSPYIRRISRFTEYSDGAPRELGNRGYPPCDVPSPGGVPYGSVSFRLLVSSTAGSTKEPTLGVQPGICIRINENNVGARNTTEVYLPLFQASLQGEEVSGKTPGCMVSEQHLPETGEGNNGGGTFREILQEIEVTTEETYDILNAGPRRRFTANGVLVSNCAYGVSPASIERKLEVDTGEKPEEGTGDQIMETLYSRQRRAMEWLDEQQEIPRNFDHTRLASGRKRRWLGTYSRNSMDPRAWDALMSSQGREARNTPLQESVASTSAVAATRLLKFAQENNLEGRPMVLLYDAVCTLCPEREAKIWGLAHELFMYRSVAWKYGDRYLNYPIDIDYNRGWSSSPLSKEDTAALDIPDDLRHLEEHLTEQIEWYKENIDKAVCNTHVIE